MSLFRDLLVLQGYIADPGLLAELGAGPVPAPHGRAPQPQPQPQPQPPTAAAPPLPAR